MTIIPFPENSEQCCATKKTHIVLPVCPKTNARICFDPQVTMGRAVPAEGALTWLKELHEQGTEVKSIEITGPGDPLADPELIFEIAESISLKYPEINLSITTLGLQGSLYAKAIALSGISSVTLSVNSIEPEIAQKIYAWIRPGKKTVPLKEATEILIKEQAASLKALTENSLGVNIECVIYPGINDEHIEAIAKRFASSGAESMTLVPFKTVDSGNSEAPASADAKLMHNIHEKVFPYFPNVIIKNVETETADSACDCPTVSCIPNRVMLPKPSKERPNVAVVSSNGMEIDLHLGQAYQVLIYGPREDGLPCLLGTRPAPEPGGGGSRWEDLASGLTDCFALLCASAGNNPKKIMGQHGIYVLTNEGEIEGTVDALFGGNKKCKKK